MYFVDREHIEKRLLYIDQQISLYEANQSWVSPIEKLAFERLIHTIIESVLDTGNSMIDGFIMRDPGSYEDIVDILLDEKVIDQALSEALIQLITYRKMLVQDYMDVAHGEILDMFEQHLEQIKRYSDHVRRYLTEELGPVSAFRN